MNSGQVTCLVPTHERPQFLRRLLRFYELFSPDFSLSIIDSSTSAAAAENLACVEDWRGSSKIRYQHFDLNLIEKCIRGLEQVRTPFAVLCADDDFLFPDAVSRCVEFLKEEPGFSSALGRTAEFSPRLPVWCCRILRGYSIEDEQPFVRCRRLVSSWFTNFYAVYRTETLLDNFRITAAHTNSSLNYHIPEMLLSQLSALRGRIKVIPAIYSLMERHGTNIGSASRVGVRPQAEQLYLRFRDCLTAEFVQAGTEREVAEKFIDASYGYFRESDLAIRCQPRSAVQKIQHIVHGVAEKTVGLWNPGFNKHRRFVRASDLKGFESIWGAAILLMQQFPVGIPAEHTQLPRCA